MSKRVLSIVLTICMLGTVLFLPQPAHAAADQPVSEIAQAALKLIRDNEGSYGSVNKNDNGALSIGFLQWHADRALSLMRIIVNANKKQAKNILGTTLYNEITNTSTNWDKRTVNTTEAVAVSKLLTTPQGREAQDKQALQNITSYIDHGIRLGIKSASALVYFADLENQGGAGGSAGAAKLAANKAGSYAKITLDILHNATKNHYLGSYTSRRNRAYNYCKNLNWDKKYYLDVNGLINGSGSGNLSGVATFDMYINGSKVSTGVSDYYQQVTAGTRYEIKNIVPTAGYTYAGVSSGSISGTVNAATSVQLSFKTAYYTLTAYPNYSGKNYLSHTDFTSSAYLGDDTLDHALDIITRDSSVTMPAIDSTTKHNGYNSLKITNYAAGASGKDLAIRTNTQGSKTYNKYGGDEKAMTLSFYAKAANYGTKIYFRWGYEGVDAYRSVTLTTDWEYYTVPMNKVPDYGQYMHPYIDRAGTVWISEMQLEDGTVATSFTPESKGAEAVLTAEAAYGSAYTLPAAPSRTGYLFDGWYTQASGGYRVTSLAAYNHQALYAHWTVKPAEKINLAKATIAGIKDKTYTGKAITQDLTVTLNGRTLHAGTDYTVTYQNNVKVGTATVTVTGKGTYTGAIKKTFQIKKAAAVKPSYVRIYGEDRYATSLEIAAAYKKALGVSQFSTVCVADGVNFPDALAGAYFASVNKAPIITIRQNAPSGQQTKNSINYIKKNLKKGGTVYILGGPGSVPASIATTLKKAGFKVERLWGKNRYLSNIAILKAANVKAGSEFIVTTGTTFADALSASATGKPVLLVTGNALTKEQKAYLAKAQAKKITIVGTTKDVSMGIEKQLKKYASSVSRISAKTAYERSVAVAKRYFPNTRTHINIADGRKFPDALCAGPLAIKKGGPLILTNGSSDVDYQIRTYAKAAKTMKATVYGGPASVDDSSPKYILGIN